MFDKSASNRKISRNRRHCSFKMNWPLTCIGVILTQIPYNLCKTLKLLTVFNVYVYILQVAVMSECFILRNGRIIDPTNGVDQVGDLVVQNSLISSVGKSSAISNAKVIDATGCLVVPGLIDCHIHCYEHATPLGINPDRLCLNRGVTTVVDAGSSGQSTFLGLRKFIAEQSNVRVLCFLHIVSHGLASAACASEGVGGELDSLNQLDISASEKVIKSNRDMIVGVKVRLTENIADNGKNEQEAFRRALEMSKICSVPLMVHHSYSSVPIQISPQDTGVLGCPKDLRKGDIYTHSFHYFNRSCIVDEKSRTIHPDVIDARKRGVLFDVGHGKGSFSWETASICGKANFWPDIISTDLHSQNFNGPVFDLTSVMSKFLFLGMPIYDVIKAVTCTPAKAVKRETKLGNLSVGTDADITLLKIETTERKLKDSQAESKILNKWIRPVAVWKGGVQYQINQL